MITNAFDIDRFRMLNGLELDHYASQFMPIEPGAFLATDYDDLTAMLDSTDEYHAVYILEICSVLEPTRFTPNIVPCLGSSSAALCFAAYRILGSLPPSSISEDIKSRISRCSIVELYWYDPPDGQPKHIGSSWDYCMELKSKLGIVSTSSE